MRKRIVIFCPYPLGEAPSQRFRFEQYLDLLRADGYTVDQYPFLSAENWRDIYKAGNVMGKISIMITAWLRRWKEIKEVKRADYVFIHREMAQFGPPVFEWLIAKFYRKPFIYDFDDAIWLPNFSETNRVFHRVKWYGKVKQITKWANQVIVGNKYLSDFASKYNNNVVIIPTTIDLEHHHNLWSTVDNNKLVIGWTGTHTTMNYLDALLPALERLEKEFDFEFRVISNKRPDFELKSLHYVPWTKEKEIQDLAEINIGVMPLVEDQWSKGKCGFKALQYMSLGIPSVISPVGVNTEIIENQVNGFLADTSEEYYTVLKRLLNDQDLRLQIGKSGHETIKERYSVKANYIKYKRLFQE